MVAHITIALFAVVTEHVNPPVLHYAAEGLKEKVGNNTLRG